jgi:hypothetical protein
VQIVPSGLNRRAWYWIYSEGEFFWKVRERIRRIGAAPHFSTRRGDQFDLFSFLLLLHLLDFLALVFNFLLLLLQLALGLLILNLPIL